MKFFSQIVTGFLALPALVSAAYPYPITTTTPSAVFLRIFSYDNLNGRSLQLRTQSDGRQIVVIDATSPVLWAEFRKGIIYTQGKTDENQRYSLGPVSYLKAVNKTSTSSLSEFYFKNATKSTPATAGFVLDFPTEDAIYDLYHDTPIDTANGWVACQKTGYWQLFYYTYTSQEPPFLKGCQFLGIETTLAPFEAN